MSLSYQFKSRAKQPGRDVQRRRPAGIPDVGYRRHVVSGRTDAGRTRDYFGSGAVYQLTVDEGFDPAFSTENNGGDQDLRMPGNRVWP